VSHVLFTAFSNRPDAVELAHELSGQLSDRGVQSSLHLLESPSETSISAETLVVSLGGDGTFLKAASLAHRAGAYVLPVNLGRMGFLLTVPREEVVGDIERATANPTVIERIALDVRIGSSTTAHFALNEVVVERAHSGRMVRVTSFVDDVEYLTYSADGVMVATPTGSTGYNFSAGGPVVDSSLPVLLLTPIAPHFTIDRTIVVSDEKVVRLTAKDKEAAVVADGQTIGVLAPGDSIEVRRALAPVKVVANRSFDLSYRLREGLQEGHA